jgi:CRP-like cAMP-binding protein
MDSDITAKIEAFFASYNTRHYKKGHILIYTGDEVPYVYHLLAGNVKQYAISYRGDEAVLNIFKPPAFFPMSHVINKTSAKYIFEAETDIAVRQAPADMVIDFLQHNADVLYDLLRRVYAGSEGLLGRMERLMTSTAKERMAYELVLECRRFGISDKDSSCTIVLSEKNLGARAGLSRETVNREIHKLKVAELIVVQRNTIHVPNVHALEKTIGEDS